MTMLIDVMALLRVPGSSDEVQVTGLPEILESKYRGYRWVDDLEFAGTMTSSSKDVLELTGKLTFRVACECARCLRGIERTVEAQVSEVFVNEKQHRDHYAQAHPEWDDEQAAEQDDDDRVEPYTFDGETVDLSEALKDNAILALPARMFCEDNCPGLCAHCGRRKDDPACQCEEEKTLEDSPFAVLKELL